jgi:3-oxoacyl-[acyl-carrier-protein] synthase-3
MFFDKVSILSVAHVDAPHRMPTSTIEEKLAPLNERIDIEWDMLRSLSGIEARHFWDEGTRPSEVATQAGERAIEAAGIDRDKIGILINTSVCRDYVEPSTACLVHSNLGLAPECMNFDLGNACLAFINGMQVAGNMIERGQIDYALIVNGEGSRFVIEKTIERLLANADTIDEKSFRQSYATFTLGSGAAAMLLARSDLAPGGHRFRGGISLAATEHSRLCYGQVDEMITSTKRLLLAGLELAKRGWHLAQERMGWSNEVLDEVVIHQVSKVHTEQLAAMLGLDLGKVLRIYPEFGNIGPASVPIAKAVETGRIKKGDRVALMGIGSGLNTSMAEVIW